ncbi:MULTISPECIES: hypothetical protein [Saliphagus]|uniref:DUF7961 domain-containing protein n=1 Tax=Saliphagus infecundisoli TaxID=1849069 RepID=A0ABD5QES4_9EURY|nr:MULTISPECIES: hypothetical protein [Saliphagus]
MSVHPAPDVEAPIDRCRPADVTPVRLEADALESTAPDYLRELKGEFAGEGLSPAELAVEARFEADCSLRTQSEADRLRELVRAGTFLGVDRVTVSCDSVANPEKVRPALEACAERADREGIAFEVDGLDLA